MSHEIARTNGRNAIAFKGETPWHGLGTVMTEGESVEAWVTKAGLGYKVSGAPTFAAIGGEFGDRAMPNQIALYREDTGAILGKGSKTHFKWPQPREIVEFFDDLTKQAGMKLEVAGALKGGSRVWALASTGTELRIAGMDVVRPYLCLSTVYDNQRATIAQFTTVRVVCNNTLQMMYTEHDNDEAEQTAAKREGTKAPKQYVSVGHNKHFNAVAVKEELQLIHAAAEQFAEQANVLAARKVTREEAAAYVLKLFGKYDKQQQLTTQSQKVCAGVVECVERSPGATLKSADGTAWGLLNGVTHFLDFKMRARSSDNRLNSAWFGDAMRLKAKAMQAAMVLAA
jgi:phage/plasmid-like protein (TIGR03299 family)